MDKLIDATRKIARMVALVALCVAAVCTLLAFAGSFPSGFMPVM